MAPTERLSTVSSPFMVLHPEKNQLLYLICLLRGGIILGLFRWDKAYWGGHNQPTLIEIELTYLKCPLLSLGLLIGSTSPSAPCTIQYTVWLVAKDGSITGFHSLHNRTVNSKCHLPALLNWLQLVYGQFGQSNMHCTFELNEPKPKSS